MKPYYEHGGITIYHGDCREILPELPKCDLLLTDPPYGIDWDSDYTRFTRSAKMQGGDSRRSYPRVHGDKSAFDPQPFLLFPAVMLWGANCYLNELPSGSLLVWYKRTGDFLAQAEAAWWNHGRGVYVYSEPVEKMQQERVHPTQKPVGLMAWCMAKVKADAVLDPFMGSGTTLVAAKQTGRSAIGIEIEERYCEIAAKRLAQEVLPLGEASA